MWQIAQGPVSEFREVQFAELSAIVRPDKITVFICNVIPLSVDNTHRDCTVLRETGQDELCRVGNRF